MGTSFVFGLDLLVAQLRWQDLVDILLVTLIIYRVLVLVRTTGTIQMLSGLGVLAIVFMVSSWAKLVTSQWIFEKFFNNLFLIVVILFQGEIRRVLAQIGSVPFAGQKDYLKSESLYLEVAKATSELASKKWGAILVLEREIDLDYYVEMGKKLDAEIHSDLIVSLFSPSCPLHDGALLVREGRLHSASCFLPLSKNPILDKNLGTRHRAALGLSEQTDALVVVISEETGALSLFEQGKVEWGLGHVELKNRLKSLGKSS